MASAKPDAGEVAAQTADKTHKRKITDTESSDDSVESIHYDDQPLRKAPTTTKPSTTPASKTPIAKKSATPAGVKSKTSATPATSAPALRKGTSDIEIMGSTTLTAAPPAAKRPRLTGKTTVADANIPSAASMKKIPKPAPPCRVSIGDIGLHKSLNIAGNKSISDKKILVQVNEVKWDQAINKWVVLLENQGTVLPRGCVWWDEDKTVEMPLGKGEEVMVKIGTGWVEGVVEGVELDDAEGNWNYECSIVSTIKVTGPDKIKEARSPHKMKLEKSMKPEVEDGEGSGEFSFKEEN